MNNIKGINNPLSAAEAVIMKIIWESPDCTISLKDLMVALKNDYGRDYARTTVATFLSRLANKGFVESERRGRVAIEHAKTSYDEYRQSLLSQIRDFWFNGNIVDVLAALNNTQQLTEEDKNEIRNQLGLNG